VPVSQPDIPFQTVQASSTVSDVNALTTAPAPTADLPAAGAADQSSGQDRFNRPADGSSATLPQTSDVSVPTTAQDPKQQPPALQSMADSPEQTAINMQQLNSAVPSDGRVAQVVYASVPAIPNGAPQAEAGIAAQIAVQNLTVPMEMPKSAASPSNGEWTQPAGKAAAKKINDIDVAKNTELSSPTEAGKSKSTEALSRVSDGTSHGTQNNGQSTQHSQTGTVQAAAVRANVIDGGTTQAQAAAMHLVSHEAATTLRSGGGVVDGSNRGLQHGNPASNEVESGDAAVTSGINAAKLIQTMGQTEMRVGMRSSEFGNISIRTSVSQRQMLAQISLDHGDLSQALSSHVSSMQTKLENEYGLHTMIEVNTQGALSSGDTGNYSQQKQQEFVRSGRIADPVIATEPEPGLGQGATVSVSGGVRLDIRA